jgi:hypothetical protein
MTIIYYHTEKKRIAIHNWIGDPDRRSPTLGTLKKFIGQTWAICILNTHIKLRGGLLKYNTNTGVCL